MRTAQVVAIGLTYTDMYCRIIHCHFGVSLSN